MGATVFLAMVTTSPPYFVYDEIIYLPGAQFLLEGNSIRQLLLSPMTIPTGPLHSIIHALASPLTGLEAPRVRLVNCVLLATSWLAISKTLSIVSITQPYSRGAALIAVPMIWVTTGMALTEIPAMTFASFASMATAWAAVKANRLSQIWFGFVFAGLCLGTATVGRQLYLPAVVGFLLIPVFDRRLLWPALTASIVTFICVLPVLLTWGGIAPPSTPQVSNGLSISHGFLAVCYLGIVLLILAPSYFAVHWRWTVGAGVIGGLIGLAIGNLGLEVGGGISRRLSPDLANLFQRLASAALVGAAGAVLIASLVNLWRRRTDCFFAINVLLMGGLTLTAAGVAHQFSSRYLITAFPFAIFAVQSYFRPNIFAGARLLFGSLLGYFFLSNYYSVAP